MKLPAILKNKYVLYVVLFFAITNVLGFLQRRDFESLSVFVAIGVLSTYFSKNMTVNLLVAIVGSNLVMGSGMLREGFKEGAEKEKPKSKSAKDKKKEAECKTFTDKESCPVARCSWDSKSDQCVVKDAFSQRNVPSSKPAPVKGASESEEDEAIGKRIDYAATLEQAYDNLQNMLGNDGMKGLADETKRLVGQQKNLMTTLNNMAPVLNNAKETLGNLNMPDMESLKTMMDTLQGGSRAKK